jgi:multiple sugar transport system ATP-binding protein
MRHNGTRLGTPPERREALGRYAGKTVTLGVRPEHVTLESPDAAAGGLGGRIDVTEQLGSELLVDVLVGDDSLIVSRIDPERRLDPGETVSLVLHPSRLHFFDRDTEAAIQ